MDEPMSPSSRGSAWTAYTLGASRAMASQGPPERAREVLEAIAEIDRGECIELSPEQLERCIVDGEWPWPDESPG
jgi:hypothetical protein